MLWLTPLTKIKVFFTKCGHERVFVSFDPFCKKEPAFNFVAVFNDSPVHTNFAVAQS